MIELWEIVDEFPNYMISSFGNIKRIGYDTRNHKPKVLKRRIAHKGYCQSCLYKDNKLYYRYVHRLVAIAFIPTIPNKNEINHKDGNKLNNCYLNLEWCSRGDNNKHAYNTGLRTAKKGDLSNNNKLSIIDVIDIKKCLLLNLYTQKQISWLFDVCRRTVCDIKYSKSWN